ncbi:putative oxalate:formate antiporter [Schistosoma mansoni]|uniref:putative oxalate:formate antiporter n=1 Tax=Schistosoma mansoni TaxID=6183 RepID=UPI00022DCA34|nr:putative oxalate:formate antiporter [Schistosoma mansoni]|eukprot:XP_018654068.1 putative oxalate:formate antiporter [Schistosoma mansoni]
MGSGLGLGYSVVLAVAASIVVVPRSSRPDCWNGGWRVRSRSTGFHTNSNSTNQSQRFNDPDVLDRLPSAFLILGGILLSIQVIGFALLRPKPTSKRVSGSNTGNPSCSPKASSSLNDKSGLSREINISPKQVFRYIDFYLLWCIMFCDIIPITIITSAYKLFGQTFISDDRFLSAVATASSLFNCAGRIIWGEIVDRVSFKTVGSVLCAMVTTFVSYQNAYVVQFTGCGFVCLFAFFLALWIKDQKMPEKLNRCQMCTDTCRGLRIPQPVCVTAEELERLNQPNPNN